MKPWKVLSSRQTFKDPWLSVRTDKVEQPSGQILEDYHVIEYPDWVSVLAFTPEGRLIIIQEYRHGAEAITLGLPAGSSEPGETDYLDVAKRELREETGYTSDDWVQIGHAYSNWATQNNQVWFFLAFNALKTHDQDLDATEEIEVLDMAYEDYLNFDGVTPQQCHHAAALHYAERYFARNPDKRPK
tara:strand:- start:9034 stop:9594 length:561 start_codon:yes stop_codon:yes gene_type:complete